MTATRSFGDPKAQLLQLAGKLPLYKLQSGGSLTSKIHDRKIFHIMVWQFDWQRLLSKLYATFPLILILIFVIINFVPIQRVNCGKPLGLV
jgi:hypothetical protein